MKAENPFAGQTILIHGPSKVGKTKLVSSFPGPVQFIAAAPGHGFIPADQKGILVRLTEWKDFEALNKQGSPVAGHKPTTVCIDYVRALYVMCKRSVALEARVGHFSEKGEYGRALWDKCSDRFGAAVDLLASRLMDKNRTLIYIDHSKEDTVEDESKVMSGMPKQARDWIIPSADHIWFLGYGDPKILKKQDDDVKIKKVSIEGFRDERMLVLRGGDRIEAGCWDDKMRTKVIYPLLEPDLEKKTGGYWQIVKETKNGTV